MESISPKRIIKGERLRPAIGRIVSSVWLRQYQRLMLVLLSIMTIVCISWVMLVRQRVSASNPFWGYTTILPGQQWKSKAAEGYSCHQTVTTGNNKYCTFSPTSGPFWYINLVTHDNIISSVTFCVRDGALRVGDLALLWGKPTIQIFQKSGLFKWSSSHATADGVTGGWGFGYDFPLVHVTFSINTD